MYSCIRDYVLEGYWKYHRTGYKGIAFILSQALVGV